MERQATKTDGLVKDRVEEVRWGSSTIIDAEHRLIKPHYLIQLSKLLLKYKWTTGHDSVALLHAALELDVGYLHVVLLYITETPSLLRWTKTQQDNLEPFRKSQPFSSYTKYITAIAQYRQSELKNERAGNKTH